MVSVLANEPKRKGSFVNKLTKRVKGSPAGRSSQKGDGPPSQTRGRRFTFRRTRSSPMLQSAGEEKSAELLKLGPLETPSGEANTTISKANSRGVGGSDLRLTPIVEYSSDEDTSDMRDDDSVATRARRQYTDCGCLNSNLCLG